jgi:Spy/CpxP family protein refolding chaperone
MKTTNNKTLIWIIALLAIFNVTTLVTIGFHLYQSRYTTATAYSSKQQPAEGIQYNGRFFKDSLNLTSDQMEQFRKVNRAFRGDVNSINKSLNELRKSMMQNMSSSSPDTLRLNSIADSIGEQHARLKKETYRYYLGIKAICTPQQQATLKGIFQTILGTESSVSCRGKGQGEGKHQHCLRGSTTK